MSEQLSQNLQAHTCIYSGQEAERCQRITCLQWFVTGLLGMFSHPCEDLTPAVTPDQGGWQMTASYLLTTVITWLVFQSGAQSPRASIARLSLREHTSVVIDAY